MTTTKTTDVRDRAKDFATFWRLYKAHRDAIVARATGQGPQLARFYATMTPAQRELFGSRLVQAAEQAEAGTLEPLGGVFREFGVEYARAGIPYDEVFESTFRLRDYMFAVIEDEHGGNTELIHGLLVYIDLVVVHIGGAFLAERDQVILRLSVPVLSIAPRVLLAPLIGELERHRALAAVPLILGEVSAQRARVLILDFAGIARVDPQAAPVLANLASACRLMGADVLVSGLSTELASAIVDRGLDLRSMNATHDLAHALAEALELTGSVAHQQRSGSYAAGERRARRET